MAGVIETLRTSREAVLESVHARGLTEVRLFGSIMRGDSDEIADVDLLVHPGPASSVFDLAGFMAEVEEILGVKVDVVSDRGRGPVIECIHAEAVPLRTHDPAMLSDLAKFAASAAPGASPTSSSEDARANAVVSR